MFRILFATKVAMFIGIFYSLHLSTSVRKLFSITSIEVLKLQLNSSFIPAALFPYFSLVDVSAYNGEVVSVFSKSKTFCCRQSFPFPELLKAFTF